MIGQQCQQSNRGIQDVDTEHLKRRRSKLKRQRKRHHARNSPKSSLQHRSETILQTGWRQTLSIFKMFCSVCGMMRNTVVKQTIHDDVGRPIRKRSQTECVGHGPCQPFQFSNPNIEAMHTC